MITSKKRQGTRRCARLVRTEHLRTRSKPLGKKIFVKKKSEEFTLELKKIEKNSISRHMAYKEHQSPRERSSEGQDCQACTTSWTTARRKTR